MSIPLYRMAPLDIKEPSVELVDLLVKGLSRPSESLWDALISFCKEQGWYNAHVHWLLKVG